MTGADEVSAYIAGCAEPFRGALIRLRTELRALLPEAEERMSYGMPGFRLGGKMVAGYAAFARHIGYYPHSGSVIPRFATEIEAAGLKHSKSGVTFAPEHPIPMELFARILAARLAEAGLN